MIFYHFNMLKVKFTISIIKSMYSIYGLKTSIYQNLVISHENIATTKFDWAHELSKIYVLGLCRLLSLIIMLITKRTRSRKNFIKIYIKSAYISPLNLIGRFVLNKYSKLSSTWNKLTLVEFSRRNYKTLKVRLQKFM